MTDIPLDALSITDLAERKGVSKQAIHKRVKGLAAAGTIETFAGPRGSVLVSEAAYDFAVGQTGDPSKEQSAATAADLRGKDRPPPSHDVADLPAFRDAKARDAHYAAELKRLEFERSNGNLYTVAEVDAAMVRVAGAFRTAVRGMVARADAGAEALDKGMPAFRRWLSRLGDDVCRAAAAELRILEQQPEAPATPEIPDEEAGEPEE